MALTRLRLFQILNNENNCIKWCQVNNILNNYVICNICNEEMIYYEDKKIFRCNKLNCNKSISLTAGTIFHSAKINIQILIFLIYEWSINTGVENTATEYELNISVVSRWFKKFRMLSTIFYFINNQQPIGGIGKIVEIDESLVVKRKYNRGRLLNSQIWIFGGIVRNEPQSCFIEIVPNRKRETLLNIIARKILPFSTISSDCWLAYENLSQLLPSMNLTHIKVNHSKNFVNPNNSVAHTQNIEAFWSSLKRKFKKNGSTKYTKNIEIEIGDFLYKKRCEGNIFLTFINDLANYY